MENNDKKRTRTIYECEYETQKNYWVPQNSGQGNGGGFGFTRPPTASHNWVNPGAGSVFNFGSSSGTVDHYQFGNPFGNYTEEENNDEEWGEEGEDWEWVCEECGRETDGCKCQTEVCEACNQEWNSCNCEEEEGFDSVG